jgi:hypothetical protein
MDPDAAFSMLLEAIAEEDWPATREHACSLRTWLHRGGFHPGGGKIRRESIHAILSWAVCHSTDEKGDL